MIFATLGSTLSEDLLNGESATSAPPVDIRVIPASPNSNGGKLKLFEFSRLFYVFIHRRIHQNQKNKNKRLSQNVWRSKFLNFNIVLKMFRHWLFPFRH